jgi:hypothetical protein
MSDQKNPDGLDETASARKRLLRTGVWILVVGLLAASAAYFKAGSAGDSGALGYEIVNGQSYPISPGDSKSYERQMELIGGKSGVLASEFSDWFAGLWHGRRLAYTLAALSVASSLICFFLSQHLVILPPPDDQAGRGKKSD